MNDMKVIIIGGGFSGTNIAKKLDAHKELNITLFDHKDYFEYVPSIHKLMFKPEYFNKISIPYKKILKNTKIITEHVVSVSKKSVKTKKKEYPFDILVITTGIDYPIFLENKKNVYVLKTSEDGKKISKALKKAKTVLITGGGLIGVEVAGEFVEKAPNKKIIVVHSHDLLLERNPPKASKYALEFLKKRGAKIIFGEKVVKQEKGRFITNKGRKIKADMTIWCAGIKCNPDFMKGFPKKCFTEKNALAVDKYLRLKDCKNIFVGGDINGVKEEKTAHNAELHAYNIAENILKTIKKQKLAEYKSSSGPLVISLGDLSAILTYKGHVLNGLIPGLLKWIIEYYVMFYTRYL